MNWSMVLLSVVTVVLLYAFAPPDFEPGARPRERVADFDVSCIDGVEYWYGQEGNKGYLAPRIDSETLDFVTCND